MSASHDISLDSRERVRSEIKDLRRSTLDMFLLFLLAVPLLWMLHVTSKEYEVGPLDFAALIMILSSAIAFKLKRRHFTSACWVLFLSASVAESLIAAAYPGPMFQTFGVVIIIVANAILGAGQGLLAAMLSWGLPSATRHIMGTVSGLGTDIGFVLLLYLLTWAGSWLAGRPLRASVSWALEAWDDARQLLSETRARRAELYRTLRALEEATYRIERMNNELLLARHEAETARALKTRLATTLSHELRGPLNLILGFSQLMALYPERYGEPLPSVYYPDVDAIYRNSQHLASLVDDILDLSRIEAERLPLVKDHIDLEEDVVKKVIATVRLLVERKGLYLKEELAGELPSTFADPVRLRQVLSNLLINAIRFTERGGITVGTKWQDQRLIVSVQDTGQGIAKEDIPNLFKEFSQLLVAETREAAGTGLGLSISKQLVELHGGRTWVESEVGVGTTLHFSIPVSDGTPVANTIVQTRHTDPRVVPNRTCLVVHHDPTLVRLLGRYVEEYRMVGVTREQDVLTVTEELHPRAIITAPPFTDRIKHQFAETSYDVPIISLNMPGLTEQHNAKGVLSYMTKPVTTEMLAAAMRQINRGNETTILLVDDDPDFVRLLEGMLTLLPRPYNLFRAYDGRQALDTMKTVVPDVVFLDLVMPGLSGEETLEYMRRNERLRNVPVVIISAKDATDDGVAITAPLCVHFNRSLDLARGARLLGSLLDAVTPWYLPESETS